MPIHLPRFLQKSTTFYVNVVSNRFSSVFGKAGAISDKKIIENFETIPQLFMITDHLAGKISTIPRKVVNAAGKDVPGSPLNKLIEGPNNYQSWEELVKLFFAYYEPLGNAYLYGMIPDSFKQITELYCLPTDKTMIMLRYNPQLPAWVNEIYEYQTTIGGTIYHLPAVSVFHEKYMSLRYDDGAWVYGMSKYIPGDKIARELKAIHEAKTSIIENRGALGFISNDEEQPDEEQTKKFKKKLKEKMGLGGDQDKIVITTEKLRWQQMALGLDELKLIENHKYSFDQLCWLSGIDPIVFSTEGAKFADKNEAEKKMMRFTIKPKLDNFYKNLSIWLSPGYGGDRIVADWSQVPEMQEDRKLLTDLVTRQVESMLITPFAGAKILYGDNIKNPPPDEYFRKSSLVPFLEPTKPDQVVTAADMQALIDENNAKTQSDVTGN